MISDESSKESRGEAVVGSEEEFEERQQRAHGGNTSSRVMKNSWCHQCKMRKERVTACDNFFSSNRDLRCNCRFCDGCVIRHYDDDPSTFGSLPSWTCYRCNDRCTCAACKRRRRSEEVEKPRTRPVVVLSPAVHRSTVSPATSESLIVDIIPERDDDDGDYVPRKQARITQDSASAFSSVAAAPSSSSFAAAAVSASSPLCTPIYEMSALAQLAEESIQTEIASLRVERHLERQRNDIASLKAMMRQLQQQIGALMEARPACACTPAQQQLHHHAQQQQQQLLAHQQQHHHQQRLQVATDADAVL